DRSARWPGTSAPWPWPPACRAERPRRGGCTPSGRAGGRIRYAAGPTSLSGPSERLRSHALARATELLGLLEDLAFGLDRGGDDQLGLLQFADVARAHRAHAGPDRAHEVQGAVLGEGRTEEDLLERPRDAHANAGAARQVHVRRG